MAKKMDAPVMSLIEQTMLACREIKTESAVPANKKFKKLSESKKPVRKSLREEDELDPEVDDIPDDVADDVVIVTDPEMTTDEYDDAIATAQDIVDNTPEGDVPSTDEYVGDSVYQCPVCGNNFFSDKEMGADEECPVCGEIADGFVLVGDIEAHEDSEEDEAEGEDEETLDVDDAPAEECDDPRRRKMKMDSKKRQVFSGYRIDEKTFNPFLKKFIIENYKNSAKAMILEGAKICGKTLKLECKITLKSGKEVKTVISVENFKPAKKMSLIGKADKIFKVEGSVKAAPFAFEAVMDSRKVISATGFKYNFRTRKENKLVQVYGKYALKESKKSK